MMMFWGPAILSSTGYYLMTMSEFMDATIAAASPSVTEARRRRSEFKIIQGGK